LTPGCRIPIAEWGMTIGNGVTIVPLDRDQAAAFYALAASALTFDRFGESLFLSKLFDNPRPEAQD
jgi:hypothetical protein